MGYEFQKWNQNKQLKVVFVWYKDNRNKKSGYGGDLDLRIDRKQWKLRIVDSVWSLDRN